MPNVDGHQATVVIREMGYKAPIIALTAFADESNVKKCFESGMDCFLAKPVKRTQIQQMLKLYCEGF
jgi:osomolarity two-component system sensor histidine kinase SLN1